MDKFVVAGIAPFDGEYPIDIGSFTMRELQIIKRMSKVRAGELEEAFAAGDSDLILAIAVIAVRRNGKAWEAFEQLAWESELGAITFEGGEDEDEAGTSGDAVPLIPPRPSDSSGLTAEPPLVSGGPSATVGDDPPEMNLRAIGSQH